MKATEERNTVKRLYKVLRIAGDIITSDAIGVVLRDLSFYIYENDKMKEQLEDMRCCGNCDSFMKEGDAGKICEHDQPCKAPHYDACNLWNREKGEVKK